MCAKFIANFVKKGNDFTGSEGLIAYVEPYNVERIFDVPYDANSNLSFDLYRPIASSRKLPVVIDIHGGGWYGGRKENNKAYCMELAKKGFAVFCPEYTLVPEGDLRRQIRNICSFVNWFEKHYSDYNCDLENVFISGDSAGGQLASLLLTCTYNKRVADYFEVFISIKARAACFIGGVLYCGDMARKPLMSLYYKPILGRKYSSSRICDYVNFVDNIAKECPPLLLVTSEQDFMKSHSKKADKELKRKGYSCELLNWSRSKDRKHKLTHVFNILFPTYEESKVTNSSIASFFTSHILKKD